MNDQLDVLISRYLDGTLSDEDIRLLSKRLETDPEARRALLLETAQHAQLKEIFAAEDMPTPLPFPSQQRWVRPLVTAAATVALIAGGLIAMGSRYPDPGISGPCRIVSGDELQRGTVIATETGRGKIALGGYCRVRMDPRSSVRLAGEKYKEEVFLERGAVRCQADRGVGEFAVRTDIGTVSVKGTQFTVKMVKRQQENEMFDKRMVVAVLTGSVLISGTWGKQTLAAGKEAMLPPPGVALSSPVEALDLAPDVQTKVNRILSPSYGTEFRAAYRTEVRGRLFDAARRKLQSGMPQLMPKKVSPKVRAIRSKKRAGGPPSAADIALVRMASQKRARKVMMDMLHETADTLADEAAADDCHIAWLLAAKIRAKLPGEKIAAFDKAVAEANLSDREAGYITRAEAAIDAAMASYDPDLAGIVDAETGKVIVTEEQLGIPIRDDALAQRVSQTLTEALGSSAANTNVTALLTATEIEATRLNYCTAVRARLFEAARRKQAALLPERMPVLVQAKIMAIRTRLKKGGPPSPQDIARVQRATMKRTSGTMRHALHDAADAVAVRAARDEKLIASAVAARVRAKLAPTEAAAFDATLTKAGITGAEAPYMTEVEDRITAAIDSIDPDLTGIVSPVTGKIVVE